jgi:hypothetical protein
MVKKKKKQKKPPKQFLKNLQDFITPFMLGKKAILPISMNLFQKISLIETPLQNLLRS